MSDVTLFEERQVRRAFHEEEWWFVLVDIVAALTDSSNPSDYLKKLRRRDLSLADAFEGGTVCPPLALPFATSGGTQKLQCWNVAGILRLIQYARLEDFDSLMETLAKG
jgi:DNA-damage-inducible protein D